MGGGGVEARRRLVEQQQLRRPTRLAPRSRRRRIPARVGRTRRSAGVGEPQPLEQAPASPPGARAAARTAGRPAQGSPARSARLDRRVPPGQPDAPDGPCWARPDVEAVRRGAPRRSGRVRVATARTKVGLAGAVGPEQRDDLPRRDTRSSPSSARTSPKLLVSPVRLEQRHCPGRAVHVGFHLVRPPTGSRDRGIVSHRLVSCQLISLALVSGALRSQSP